ncbi:MAG TPA: HlyC/CorC family transporter [Methanomicrobia archaeon]|nr:HlyC/CorC family transporter [Methanomicrobia archaeon]
MLWAIPVILFLIFLSSFFAAAEMAFVSVNRLKVREESLSGRKNARLLERLLENPNEVVSAIVIGNNLANISASVLAAMTAAVIFGRLGPGIATAVMTFLIVIFSEAIPKAYGIHNDAFAFRTAKALYLIRGVFYTVTKLFSYLSEPFLKLLGKELKEKVLVTEEEVKALIALGVHEGTIKRDEQKLVGEVFEFDQTPIGKVYVPLKNVISLPETANVEDLIKRSIENGFSRFPVYREQEENIIGMVHVKDTHLKEASTPIKELIREIMQIPATMMVDDVLRKLQREKVHMAAVVAEGNRIVGIVTMEDLIEQLFGEIHDEHDKPPRRARRSRRSP